MAWSAIAPPCAQAEKIGTLGTQDEKKGEFLNETNRLASLMGKSKSTIYNEWGRHSGKNGPYFYVYDTRNATLLIDAEHEMVLNVISYPPHYRNYTLSEVKDILGEPRYSTENGTKTTLKYPTGDMNIYPMILKLESNQLTCIELFPVNFQF
jgi:hypothetical protein